jgi:ABC-type sulfate transport system permease component
VNAAAAVSVGLLAMALVVLVSVNVFARRFNRGVS